MLTVEEILHMMGEGIPLPQEKQRMATFGEQIVIQTAEQGILQGLLEVAAADGDVLKAVVDPLLELSGQYGWYATTSCLSAAFAARFAPADIPHHLPDVSQQTKVMLTCLSLAAQAQDTDQGAWTIPMAMLADLGEEEAVGITACAAFCAARAEVARLGVDLDG